MRMFHPQRAKGFTLLELLVVSILTTGLAIMTAQMWRHFSAQATDLSRRTGAAQELRLALESVSDDFGSVVWATPTTSGGLLIERRAPGGQTDVVIEYALRQGRLMRTDGATAVTVPVAENVSNFVADDVTPAILRVAVSITAGGITRRATLYWSRT